ncbi:DUF3997 domain-containing protein [Paludibacter sp.]|uniref:DUF3997 domain-containing protein n=1 Tax=Paludibacter sp. TaxID=1898105 RepID=UPI0025CC2DE9|nr:DUF3997 domain-containing protein [Paludibacter sp.]
MRNTVLFCSLICIIYSCDFAIKKHVVDHYYLIAADVVDDLELNYREEEVNNSGTIIDAMVFAIGYNDKYMIVKQHPRTFPNPPDTAKTNYYILPLRKGMNWRTRNGLMGPLTLQQFNDKCKELNIVNIPFRSEFDFSK